MGNIRIEGLHRETIAGLYLYELGGIELSIRGFPIRAPLFMAFLCTPSCHRAPQFGASRTKTTRFLPQSSWAPARNPLNLVGFSVF
jgi:hypothetical protein